MLGTTTPDDMTNTVPALPISFKLALEKRLQLHDAHNDLEPAAIWRHYGYHIGRYPQDLRAHVQRLLTGINAGFSDSLEGALQDLFLCVGDNGFSLREKMYNLVQPHLSEESSEFFASWLSSGKPQNVQWRSGSILTDSFGGLDKLVTVEQDQAEANLTIMDEIQAYLEYGQIDAAQSLLEKELEKSPSDLQLAQELLNIYLYTRDKNALQNMTNTLHNAGVELSEDWVHVLQEADNW